jgi:hypothetical protein
MPSLPSAAPVCTGAPARPRSSRYAAMARRVGQRTSTVSHIHLLRYLVGRCTPGMPFAGSARPAIVTRLGSRTHGRTCTTSVARVCVNTAMCVTAHHPRSVYHSHSAARSSPCPHGHLRSRRSTQSRRIPHRGGATHHSVVRARPPHAGLATPTAHLRCHISHVQSRSRVRASRLTILPRRRARCVRGQPRHRRTCGATSHSNDIPTDNPFNRGIGSGTYIPPGPLHGSRDGLLEPSALIRGLASRLGKAALRSYSRPRLATRKSRSPLLFEASPRDSEKPLSALIRGLASRLGKAACGFP